MIKYLGSKRTLLPAILARVDALDGVATVLDLFSGTARVGHALKGAGYQVHANDLNAYATTLARCYVEADEERHAAPAKRLIEELNALPGTPGKFTQTYCVESRFFQAKNGARIEAMRHQIQAWQLEPILEAVLLTALMEAADRVDSTTGVQMAYLKEWAPRAHKDIELRLPSLLPQAAAGPGRVYHGDALETAGQVEADLAYLDPPYNQHKYLGNYHLWETLVRWDDPEVYGVARKRVDVRERKSPYNSRPRAFAAFEALIDAVQAPKILISFSDEGFIGREQMESLLSTRGNLQTFEHDFRRYVGAQIGIHNPAGEKVGTVSHTRNREYLYLLKR
ncbi:MAG: DNA methyltransferase [Myxococcales bacterium]|nr:DNA methyltransferase [Myxococcales bacterium]